MKKTVLLIMIICLLLPKIQEKLEIIEFNLLSGTIVSTEQPQFSFEEWLSGDFQNNYSNYIDQTYGLRNFFIRLYNQIDFSLFKKAHSQVTIGKDNYLFQDEYILEVTGQSFIGDDAIKETVHKIKTDEQYLKAKGISLITILAPGKTDYYKEFLPEYYSKKISDKRNYNSILKFASKENIHLLDFNKWALQLKDTSRYPLFSKQGIHWNYYCVALCSDSIIKYIEKERNENLLNFSWTLEVKDELRDPDNDLGDLLNIYEKLPFTKMPYPKYSFDSDTNVSKPRLLVIGDSFYWNIFNDQIFGRIFRDETYYYYYNSINPKGKSESEFIPDLNILREVEKFDVILLLQSSANYNNIGVNFVQAFDYAISQFRQRKLKEIEIIKNDQNLLNQTILIADSIKISRDSSIIMYAERRTEEYFDRISNTKIGMRNNFEWMQVLYRKANDQNKSIEQVMQMDAEWIVEQEEKKNRN